MNTNAGVVAVVQPRKAKKMAFTERVVVEVDWTDENKGTEIVGRRLVSIEVVKYKDGPGLVYTLKTGTPGEVIRFKGASRLNQRLSVQHGGLVFPTRTGMPLSDSNLLARHLKPAGKAIGASWLSWHTLRRTHATLLSQAGASPKDAQAQLGHAHMSTTMDIYTQPTPSHQRQAVERLAQMVTSWPHHRGSLGSRPFVFNDLYGGHSRIRTYDFHRVKVALYR